MSLTSKSVTVEVRVDIRSLALCAKYLAEQGVYIPKKGSFVRRVVEDFADLARVKLGIELPSVEEAIKVLQAYGLGEIASSDLARRAYLVELAEALTPAPSQGTAPNDLTNDPMVQRALEMLTARQKEEASSKEV